MFSASARSCAERGPSSFNTDSIKHAGPQRRGRTGRTPGPLQEAVPRRAASSCPLGPDGSNGIATSARSRSVLPVGRAAFLYATYGWFVPCGGVRLREPAAGPAR